jgi:site-specific recombinase XerD
MVAAHRNRHRSPYGKVPMPGLSWSSRLAKAQEVFVTAVKHRPWIRLAFPIHPHMLRHGCGYALANAGHDTRAIQAWMGHKNIQHTVRYTELAPDRFRDFWRD